MPFAGIINKPDNMTSSEYTSQNFTYCIQTILKSIGNTFLEPVYYVLNAIKELEEWLIADPNSEQAAELLKYLQSQA